MVEVIEKMRMLEYKEREVELLSFMKVEVVVVLEMVKDGLEKFFVEFGCEWSRVEILQLELENEKKQYYYN